MKPKLHFMLMFSVITVLGGYCLAPAYGAEENSTFFPDRYVGVDRYYNKSTYQQFYNVNHDVLQVPAGFVVQQYDYFYLQPEAGDSVEPFYQCYSSGSFLYTTDSGCENKSSDNQGVLGYISQTEQMQTTALHKLYRPGTGSYFYTVRNNDRDFAIENGFSYEGIIGYVWVPPMYITPIYEGADENVLMDMIETLTPDGVGEQIKLGWAKSSWYLNTDAGSAENDYRYNSSTLDTAIAIAEKLQLPLTINMNGGRWMNLGDLPSFLSSSIPFFHIKMPDGEQLLTADANERKKAEFRLEGEYVGVEGGIFAYQVPDSVPLYRFKRDGASDNRIFTSSDEEREALLSSGLYLYEGIVGFVLSSDEPYKGMPVRPLYRLFSEEKSEHHFTSSDSVRDSLMSQGWKSEGISGYLTSSPWVAMDNFDYSLFADGFGQQFVSMSRLNKVHNFYKKRNLQAASNVVKAFYDENPHLLASVSTDSESLLSDPFGFLEGHGIGDYTQLSIEEWRQWLTATGIYDAQTGEYAGQARRPFYSSIDEFNIDFGTSFDNWEELQPPRDLIPSDWSFKGIKTFLLFWNEWREWGIRMLDHHIQDMGDWIAETGIPEWKIYAHQTPALFPKLIGDSLDTAEMFDGETIGLTMYDIHARVGNIFYTVPRARKLTKHAGIFEWNPSDLYLPWLFGNGRDRTSYETHYEALNDLFDNTYRVIAPNTWPVDHNFPSISIKGRPLGRPLETSFL